MAYHRYNNSNVSPDNGCGYAMFAENEDHVMMYGEYHWTFDRDAVDAEELIEAAIEAGFEGEFYSADELNPEEIVNSAAALDDLDAVEWIWENVCEPRGWLAIRTNNGAVIFDPSLAKLTK